jgi:hypothetical protein
MIDCDCPHCGSRNTKAFSVLYRDGTRRSDSRRDGWFYYRRSFGFHSAQVRGQSQTLTARLAAPPGPPIGVGLVFVLLIIGFALGGTTGFCIAAAVGTLLMVLLSDAKSQDSGLWSSTFRCGRCGTVFAVVESDPILKKPVGNMDSEPGVRNVAAHSASKQLQPPRRRRPHDIYHREPAQHRRTI